MPLWVVEAWTATGDLFDYPVLLSSQADHASGSPTSSWKYPPGGANTPSYDGEQDLTSWRFFGSGDPPFVIGGTYEFVFISP